jgi:hypothetical protein
MARKVFRSTSVSDHGVVSAAAQGMAARQSPQRQPAPAADSMDLDRLRCILGARRCEPTAGSEPRGNDQLIDPNQHPDQAPTPQTGPRPDLRRSRPQLHLASSNPLSSFAIPIADSPAAAFRAITTTSNGSANPVRCCRNHSRMPRFTRFLTTAPPTRRLTVTPRRLPASPAVASEGTHRITK